MITKEYFIMNGEIKMQKNENNIIIYQDEDGVTKISVKFNDEDIWLTQN